MNANGNKTRWYLFSKMYYDHECRVGLVKAIQEQAKTVRESNNYKWKLGISKGFVIYFCTALVHR